MFMRRIISVLFSLVLFQPLLGAEEAKPEFIPHLSLQAGFANKARWAIFDPGEPIALRVRVSGWRKSEDTLLWELRDHEGSVCGSGEVKVAAGSAPWEAELPVRAPAAGYFEVHLKLAKAEITLPRAGSRPEGFVSFGVLPAIARLPLKWNDDSRFGAQGTNFLETGKFMEGNPYRPLYPALGAVWVYDGYRMGEREKEGPGTFKPRTDPEFWRNKVDYWAETGLSPLIDLHGLPDWLLARPEGVKRRYDNPTNAGQTYAPNDWQAFENYVRDVALEQAARRKALLPKQKNNYYQIHWEPDWHWKGTDEEFIRMYEVAHRAIRSADPDGLLVGPNYGVLDRGNDHLRRLFEKGLGRYLDGIATHTYYIPFGLPEPRGLPGQVRDLVAMTRKYLPSGAKILNTEWGTDYHGRSLFQDRSVLRGEWREFLRGHLIALGEGIDCTWYFYTADTGISGGGLMYNLTAPNPVFGAIWVSPKPVAMAAAAATRLLDGTRSLGPLPFLGENVMAYLFDRSGERVIALWSADNQRRKLRIPAGVGEVRVYDGMGNVRTIAAENGFATVTIDDVPSYIAGVSPRLYAEGALVDRVLPVGLTGDRVGVPQLGSFSTAVAFRNGEEISLKGEGKRLVLPRELSPGTWLVATGDKPFLHPKRAALVTVEAPVLLTEDFGKGLALRNQTKGEVRGRLRFHAGDRAIDGGEFLLRPGQVLQAALPAELQKLRDGQSVRVDFVDAEGSVSPGPVLDQQVLPAKRAPSAPASGSPFEGWLLEEFLTLDGKEHLRARASDWQGPGDLSGRVAFRYDDNNLYIAITVRDQSHVQTKDEPNLWQEDSVQIGLAARPNDEGWQIAQKLAVGLRSSDGRVMLTREPHSSGLPGGTIDPERFRARVERTGDETTYFLAIPWEEIDPEAGGVPVAGRIGVGLYLNDVDIAGASRTARKVMEGFGEGMGFFLPRNFGVLQLEGAP